VTDGTDLAAVRLFEDELDRALESRRLFRDGGTAALRLAANVCEHLAAERPGAEGRFVEGLQVLAQALVGRASDMEPEIDKLFADLDFAAHYHLLRDFLYYTYNAPTTMSWEFDDHSVQIRFADASLPRQFYLAANSWFVDFMHAFSDNSRTEQIERLVAGAPEFEKTAAGRDAMDLIELEVNQKLDLYFNFVADVDADLGGCTTRELFAVYRLLLVKAIYHRYHAQVNGSRGAIFMDLDGLAREIADSREDIREAAARAAVLSMSYGPADRDAGFQALYFSLYHLPDRNEIVMLPHHFALWEGYVNLLRLIAMRDPALFNRVFAQPLGTSLTRRMAEVFESVGFSCLTDIKLANFDAGLPDVDLLVISEEPTLGYVVFVCEVKSPIPPRWAKDQLRVLAPDSVAKAFVQLEALERFFGSDTGIAFLRGLLPPDGLPDFDEFALLVNTMVITSDNAGAFFSDRRRRIIDFRTLSHLVRRSDGDTAYILHVLKEFRDWADAAVEIVPVEAKVGGLAVTYEDVTIKSLMDFAPTEFRSADIHRELARRMLEAGDKPLDVLQDREGGEGHHEA
jgi:hypothetical protein